MNGLNGAGTAIAALKPPPDERDGPTPGMAAAPVGSLVAKLQRLADLQEELLELDRLPDLAATALEALSTPLAPPPAPEWQQRTLEIEAEMEQLREEIEAEEAARTPEEIEAGLLLPPDDRPEPEDTE